MRRFFLWGMLAFLLAGIPILSVGTLAETPEVESRNTEVSGVIPGDEPLGISDVDRNAEKDGEEAEAGTVAVTSGSGNEAVLVHDYTFFSVGFQGLSMDEVYGNVLLFSFTNQMDEPLMISVDYLLMDGVMTEPFFADLIEPGETRTSQIVVESTARYMKSWELTEVVLDLWVYLPEKLYDGDLFHDEVRFLPGGENGVRKWQREARESDILLLDNSFVRMVLINAERGNGNDLRLILFTEGKYKRDLLVRIEQIWINGKSFEMYYAGKCKGEVRTFSAAVIPDGLLELIGRPGMNELRMTVEYLERDGQAARTLKRETVRFSM